LPDWSSSAAKQDLRIAPRSCSRTPSQLHSDLKSCELHILQGAGHFALETHADEIAALIRELPGRRL
jgi:pimeloyl-ACP methyl ester carboxylesterase